MLPFEVFEILFPYLKPEFFQKLELPIEDKEKLITSYQDYLEKEVFLKYTMRSDAVHYILKSVQIKDKEANGKRNPKKANKKKN